MKELIVLFIAILFLMSDFTYANASTRTQVFRLNSGSPESLSNEKGDAFYNQITAEIFKRLDIKLKFVRVQSKRALMLANKGVDDGNIARVEGIEKNWTNLVRVPESIITWEFTAFSKNKDIKINGWESLKPFSVGHVRGWLIYQKNTAGAKNVIQANDSYQLFRLLQNGRIDIALNERFQAPYFYKQLGYKPKRLSSSLAKKPLFIYLHKRHKSLVPKMAAVISQMKKDGSYQKIFDRSFNFRK